MVRRLSIVSVAAVLLVALTAARLYGQGTFDLRALVVPGDPAPAPAALVRARFPSLGAGGQVAFEAEGVLLQTPDQQIVVAGYGDPAPGGGIFIAAARGVPPSINASGQIVFTGETTPPSRNGIFMYSSGTTTQVVALGDPAPGGGTFEALTAPVVNDSGTVAFLGTAQMANGIFISSQGGLTPLVQDGDPAPGGGTFDGFSFPSINAGGHVVFTAGVSGGSPGIFLASGSAPVVRIVATSDPVAKGSVNDTDDVAYVLNENPVGVYLFSHGMLTTLARPGDPAPGGGSFASFDSPGGNASGQVAFTANLSAGLSGVFLFSNGALTSIVHPGDVSPEGDNFTFVETAVINADGQVAFTGRLKNAYGGVYLATQGVISRVAGFGDPVARSPVFWGGFVPSIDNTGRVVFTGRSFPAGAAFYDQDLNPVFGGGEPTPDGGVLTSWSIPPAMNDAGQLVVLSQSSRQSTYDLFLWSNRTLSAVASYGDPAPGGGTFTDFAQWLLAMNNSGVIAFDGTVSAPGRSGLFTISGTTVTSLVQVGDAAPGGGTFKKFGPGSINASGQVVFLADVAPPGRSGVFLWSAGTTTTIALAGDAAQGGGTFAFDVPIWFVLAPSINAAGQVAFGAGLSTGQRGVFLFDNGTTTRVARPGDPAPGGGTLNLADTPALNDGGQVVFSGRTSSVAGMLLLSGGSLFRVAVTGDPAPRGGTFTLIRRNFVLNNLGQIAFDGDLSGGGRGVFLAVPR